MCVIGAKRRAKSKPSAANPLFRTERSHNLNLLVLQTITLSWCDEQQRNTRHFPNTSAEAEANAKIGNVQSAFADLRVTSTSQKRYDYKVGGAVGGAVVGATVVG